MNEVCNKDRLSYLGRIRRKQSSLEKTVELGKVDGIRKRRKPAGGDRLHERSPRQESTGAEQGC